MGCLGCLGGLRSLIGNTASADARCKEKGLNADQQQIIHYFYDERGCLKKGISDAEFDANKERQISAINFKTMGLKKLGLDEEQVKEIDPIMLIGPVYTSDSRRGADGVYRYSEYEITYIFCSSDQVYAYKYTLKLDSSAKTENTEEYFYKDITNFTTSDELKDEIKITVFKIVVPGGKFQCSMVPNDETEGKIQALKAKLREKKNS